MSRYINDPIVVTWTERQTVAVGHHKCAWCAKPTPDPTNDQLVAWCRANPTRCWLWPFGTDRGDNEGRSEPTGWSNTDDGTLCPDCTAERKAAVSQSKARRTAP